MAWWDNVPTLTPVAVWDALNTSSTQILDRVGTNHITVSAAGAVAVDEWLTKGVRGTSNPMTLTTSIPVPSTGVIAALWLIRRRHVLLQGVVNGTTDYLFHQNESNRIWYSARSNVGYAFGLDTTNTWRTVTVLFGAVVMNGTNATLYINGVAQPTALPLSQIMVNLVGIGYGGNGNEYNLDSDEKICALGVWTGTITLAELQAMETAVRADLAGTPTSFLGLPPLEQYTSNIVDTGYPGGRPGFKTLRGLNDVDLQARNLVEHFGDGLITGVLTKTAQPTALFVSRRVVLISERSRYIVAETWSDAATGYYEFRGLNRAYRYTVLAYDHTGEFGAVVADGILPAKQ